MTADSGGHTASTKVTVEITYEPPQVSIVSHADGDTVQAGDDLVLVGQSKTKFFALPDNQVTWTVIRAGTTVGHGGGHQLTVPGHKVVPGSYQVRFIGHDGTTTADAEITVVAEPKSPSAPTATITAPAAGTSHSVSGSLGSGAEFSFAGTAVDSDGTVVSGTHFRWIATRADENGPVTTVLCEGSSAGGGPGAGGFATVKNCASFTAELTGHHYGGHTNYTVVLEVTDADGETDTDSVAVKVYTPPAS